ncbi:MAG: hybrid sensor histidine kinase/response regulator [Betaproteobacteria bacterium HGW-Betaproteobacteria-16]|nr:MAG: hybrid sensor histidine kinase/response regulator [Betaproteobacteria bacterium HGW-Betaproteobacteria-16]
MFQFRVLPDGTRKLDHMTRSCYDLWELDANALSQDMSSLWSMVDARDLPAMRASIKECAEQLRDWSWQWRIHTPSGRTKWLHGTGRPLRETDGTLVWHVFVVDQTDNLQAQENLRASEERFRQLIDGIPNVAVQGYDANLVCRFWNRASERLYGYSTEEAVGASLLDLLIPPSWHARVTTDVQTMFASGQVIPASELKLRRKDGSAVWVYSSHVLLRREGQAPEFFSIDYDLTERQTAEDTRLQLQSQLRESQKMEALGTLAGGVAHDFNNIVAAILGNVELALDDVPDSKPARTSLYEIRKAGRRARDLVQQILAFSRRQDSTRQPTCLRAVLEEAHSLLRATLPADVTLQLHVDPNLPAVMANATQIEQVVLNLATNALQAVQGQGGASVQLRLERVEQLDAPGSVDEVETLPAPDAWPGVGVRLSVIDNGSGMPPETLGRVFEPFFTTKAPGAGTGLGLAVVHGILREHGAALRVRSQHGAGTVFTAVFPGLTDAAPDEPLPPQTESTRPARPWGDAAAPHVLYVDDDEAITFLVRRLLERDGYRVSAYTDAHDALDALRSGPLDVALCITDFNMPRMSGLRLAREVKALHPNLPVAIASGYISEELRLQAPAAGVDEVIYKPDTVEALCDAIARLIRR